MFQLIILTMARVVTFEEDVVAIAGAQALHAAKTLQKNAEDGVGTGSGLDLSMAPSIPMDRYGYLSIGMDGV